MTPSSRVGPLIAGAVVLSVLAVGGFIAWRASANVRARWSTNSRLRELGTAMGLASEEIPDGPMGVEDGWGREIEHRVTPLGEFLVSAGPDGRSGNLDDLVLVLALSPLGDALDAQAERVREGEAPDRGALRRAAGEAFGQPVSVEFAETVVFFDASGEPLLDVAFDAFGWPQMP